MANIQPHCFIVRSADGAWARGTTLTEAFKNLGKGCKSTLYVNLIVGDATAEVDRYGGIIRDAESANYDVGKFRGTPRIFS